VDAGERVAVRAGEILEAWSRAWTGPPARVEADERLHSALVEALRPRVAALEPLPLEGTGLVAEELAVLLRTALDAGGTLIAGGRLQLEPEPAWEPALIVNLGPEAPLWTEPAARGPFLCVLRRPVLRRAGRPDGVPWIPEKP